MMNLPHMLKGTDPWPRTHNALNDFYQYNFREAVRKGDLKPYVWPYESYGVFLLLAYLMLPPTKSRIVQYAFYPVFGFFSWWTLRGVFETKSGSLVATYLMGMVNTWAVLWVAARFLFTDYRAARRIERRPRTQMNLESAKSDSATKSVTKQNGAIRRDGGKTLTAESLADSQVDGQEYYWQTLPSRFYDRVDFIVDLLFSMRGPGWAHQARSIPGPPKAIALQLNPPPPSTKSVVRGYTDKQSLLRTNALRLVKIQIYLDIIKTIMTHDPYFLGFVDPPAPAPSFLPTIVQDSPVLTRWYRLILSMYATRTSLAMVFCLSPLFFSGILGPKIMGLRAEPWYYSDFGGDWRILLTDGIAGWWGAWWHQIFRLGFEAPSKWICDKLNISSRSAQGKAVGVFTAFICSGLLHGFASIAMMPETKPWPGPFAFFLLQALGTIVEAAVSQALRKVGITQKTPVYLRKAFVVAWLATWAYYTGPLLVEDFARGGVWLYEPVPFSVLKMLGFGEPDDHWWRWKGRNLFWYRGDRWWKSGIAI